MYPVLPFGPMTVPTGPIVLLVAVTVGLEVAGRYGRQLRLRMDDIWNVGLLAILVGLIVARLWNVIQFWPIYTAEPWLIISVRPSGFALFPGILAAAITAYAYMLRHALDPAHMIAALGVGIITAMAIVHTGMFLTGTLIGVTSELPWALPFYGEYRHPVALYYGVGFTFVVVGLWAAVRRTSPNRLILLLTFGCGMIYLGLSAYEFQSATILGLRVKQLGGLLLAILSVLLLSRRQYVSLSA